MGAPAGHDGERTTKIEAVAVNLPITLGQFVKAAGLADTGGDAKLLVTSGEVRVNGEVETRRGHKLSLLDVVETRGSAARVVACSGSADPGPERTSAGQPRG
jgi:ribosome-associated protein